jgi:hypothetical protein
MNCLSITGRLMCQLAWSLVPHDTPAVPHAHTAWHKRRLQDDAFSMLHMSTFMQLFKAAWYLSTEDH